MSWRKWTFFDWNGALIRHYFSRQDLDALIEFTRFLAITAEQLLLVAGDPPADPEEVKDAFFRTARERFDGVRADRSFLRDAIHENENWDPLSLELPPPFFAHLFLFCCAASFCEEPEDAASVHANLRDNILRVDADVYRRWQFDELPPLWVAFSDWTRRNSDRFKVLVLPKPPEYVDARMTRIGQAVSLAFPRAVDVRLIAECLSEFTVPGFEPSLEVLPTLVRRIHARIKEFGQTFRQRFEELETLLLQRRYSEIGLNPAWEAIREATGRDWSDQPSSGPQLFAARQIPEGFSFLLLSPIPDSDGITDGSMPEGFGKEWIGKSGDFQEPIARLFAMDARLAEDLREENPRMVRLLAQGVLLFRPRSDGWYELTSDRAYEDVGFALVRKGELAKAFVGRFGGICTLSPFLDWDMIECPRVSLVTDDDLASPLASVSCLHMVPQTERKARLVSFGGIRYDDIYLNNGFRMPRFRCLGIDRLNIERPGEMPIFLERAGDVWFVSPKQPRLLGTYVLRGGFGAHPEEKVLGEVKYGPGPDRPEFPIQNTQNMLVEGPRGFRSLRSRPAYIGDAHSLKDLSHLFACNVYLGIDLGIFHLQKPMEMPAWELSWSGSEWRLDTHAPNCMEECPGDCSRNGHCSSTAFAQRLARFRPTGMSESKSLRRRWRDFLLKALPDNECSGRMRHHIRPALERPSGLTTIGTRDSGPPPRLMPAETSFCSQSVMDGTGSSMEDLGRTIAALGHSRISGIGIGDWIEAARHFLGSDANPFEVLRTWEECGLINVFLSARWNTRKLHPECPTIGFFGTLSGTHAVQMGLWTPEQETTVRAVFHGLGWKERTAKSISQGSISPMYRWEGECESIERNITDALKRESVRAASLDLDQLVKEWDRDQYDAPGRLAPQADEIIEQTIPELGTLLLHRRRNAPTFWSVPGGPRLWSISRERALAMLARQSGMEPFRKYGGNAIVTSHHQIRLPLPLARLSAWTGPSLPGNARDPWGCGWVRVYEFPSQTARDMAFTTATDSMETQEYRHLETFHA